MASADPAVLHLAFAPASVGAEFPEDGFKATVPVAGLLKLVSLLTAAAPKVAAVLPQVVAVLPQLEEIVAPVWAEVQELLKPPAGPTPTPTPTPPPPSSLQP